MRAVRFHAFGGSDALRVDELPDPLPGRDEVRVRVTACGLNHVDVDVREGVSRLPVSLPHTLGMEVVGVVDALGDGVRGLSTGDRVIVHAYGGPVIPGITGPGGYGELIVASAAQLVPLPAEIDDAAAAALQLAFGTAWHMLFTRAQLRPGETVLVTSVSSGIASAAVQLARLTGARVIGTSSSTEKLDVASGLGLDHGIDYTRESVPDEVRRLTGGRGADVVFEHVGGERFQEGVASLAPGGRLVTAGAHAGEVVELDIIPFFRAQQTILGSTGIAREELEHVVELARRGTIRPLVAATYPLVEAAAAMDRLEARNVVGKVVLLA